MGRRLVLDSPPKRSQKRIPPCPVVPNMNTFRCMCVRCQSHRNYFHLIDEFYYRWEKPTPREEASQ